MPFDPQWGQIAKEAPDARAVRSRNEKRDKLLGWMEECFCVNCGCSQGMISRDWAQYVFALCDACVVRYGKPPADVVELPEVLVKGHSSPQQR
jgi:hypothetical protein